MDRDPAPLVLLQVGLTTWRVLGPRPGFGVNIGVNEGPDRRYEELATVRGNLYDATARLHELEKGRA